MTTASQTGPDAARAEEDFLFDGPRKTRGLVKKRWLPSPLPRGATGAPASAAPAPVDARAMKRLSDRAFDILVAGPRQEAEEAAAGGRELREILEELGGTWIHVGRHLASRSDLFPGSFLDELSQLRDRSAATPTDSIRTIVEEDLGHPIDRLFTSFSEEPAIVSSRLQTHLACLRQTGEQVRVSVLYPRWLERLDEDLKGIGLLTARLSASEDLLHFPWVDMVRTRSAEARRTKDLRLLANSLVAMRGVVRRQRRFLAPKLYRKLCTERVLVVEQVDAPTLQEFLTALEHDEDRTLIWCGENRIHPERLARRLLSYALRQIFESDDFLANLNAGGLLVLRRSALCLRIYGLTSHLERTQRRHLGVFLKLVANESYRQAFEQLLLLTEPMPPVDPAQLRRELVSTMRAWGHRTMVEAFPYQVKSLANLWDAVSAVARRQRILFIQPVQDAFRLLRVVDRVVAKLDERLSYPKALRRFFPGSIVRTGRLRSAQGGAARPVRAPDPSGQSAADVPFLLMDTADNVCKLLETGGLNFQSTSGKLAFILEMACRQFRVLILLSGLFFTAALAHQRAVPIHSVSQVASSLYSWASFLPRLGWIDWVLVVALHVWTFQIVNRLIKTFARTDSHLPFGGGV
ncbi:MAG: AarF/ABC1/UbiB kinase family protein [Candidatus Riflebacteria bacterium]|nr:AarF/ABC1/UbiB kinase family protein [Candidatus Riflebacteria bacterium]